MTTTKRGLKKLEGNDPFLAIGDAFNDNMDKIDGLTVLCSQAEYSAMETHDDGVVYFVNDGGKITIYQGDIAVQGGGGGDTILSGAESYVLTSEPITAVMGGNATEVTQ